VGVFGFDPPEEIQLDMIRNLGNASAYSDSKGIFAARKAIMQYCQEKGIQGVTLDDIYTGNGVSELIVLAMNALLNNGDEVLVPAPDYPLWTAAVSLSGGTPVHYLCDESKEWAPDLVDLRKKITPRTKAIVVINPNNPTGKIIEPEVIKELLKLHPNKLFIIDEAYYEFSEKTCVGLTNDYDNIIVTRTFSKAFSLASIRLGYICTNETNIDQINKIRNTKEVNSFAQILGTTALNNVQYIKERVNQVNKNKELFVNELKKLNIEFIESMSNFVLIRVKDSSFLINRLMEKNILIRDRSNFIGLENCVRITIGEMDDMMMIIKTQLKTMIF
jgi:alanine-synthesizing transaminase